MRGRKGLLDIDNNILIATINSVYVLLGCITKYSIVSFDKNLKDLISIGLEQTIPIFKFFMKFLIHSLGYILGYAKYLFKPEQPHHAQST